jgi:MFS family permease
MFVGRGIVGVSVGTLSCVGPMYSSEVATPKIRGFMTSFYQINVSVFLLIGSIFGNFVRGTSNGWRYLLGLQFVMGLLLATLLSIVPESPSELSILCIYILFNCIIFSFSNPFLKLQSGYFLTANSMRPRLR